MTPVSWFAIGFIAGGFAALWLFPPHVTNINEPKLKIKNSSDIDAAQSLTTIATETTPPPKSKRGFFLFRIFKKRTTQ